MNGKRPVLPSSEDVSTWWDHCYNVLIRGEISRFLGIGCRGTAGEGLCGVRVLLDYSGAQMSSSPFTYSALSTWSEDILNVAGG
jgi:hypothetical protein